MIDDFVEEIGRPIADEQIETVVTMGSGWKAILRAWQHLAFNLWCSQGCSGPCPDLDELLIETIPWIHDEEHLAPRRAA